MLVTATAAAAAVFLVWRFNYKLVIRHNPFDGRGSTGQGWPVGGIVFCNPDEY